jgi:3-(3-hydroxy-phenyl)propionate hydroxylase
MTQRRPVVIAGAGPTGLMCALSLRRQGIPVVLCEAEPGLTHDLRAGSFHPPTLEMMAPYGITERMLVDGIKVRHWQIRNKPGDLIAEFDLGLLADITPYPHRLHLEQHRLTPIQLDILRSEGGAEIRFGCKITGFAQRADGVSVMVDTNGGAQTIEASWLIGADGGRSVVRKSQDIEFAGFTYQERFLVITTPTDFEQLGFAYSCYVSDPKEWCALFKVPGHDAAGLWRVVFPTRPEAASEELLDHAAAAQRLQGFLPCAQPYPILHTNLYTVHQRVAASYRRDRVLLAGDAAHVNNPLGGMGMNFGIHDAVSLADKLTRVLKGESDHLLHLYDRQRRHVANNFLQAMTIQNKRILEETNVDKRNERISEMRETASDPVKAHAFLLRTSMFEGLWAAEKIS